MKIEIIKLDELKPLEKNVRKHNENQLKELIRSLNQFGQTRAIIIDEDNNILIGNGLYLAMRKNGDTSAECSRVIGLSDTQKKKLVLSDNRIYALGADDYANIEDFINEISLAGDFDIAGFDESVIREMTREMDEVSADVKAYGLIPEDKRKEEPQSTTTENQQVANPNPVTPHAQPEQQNPMFVEERIRKSVVCPSCGELIYID